MKKFLMDRYALSDQGAKDMTKAIRWNILVDILYILPVFLSFYILQTLFMRLEDSSYQLPKLWTLISLGLIIFFILFIVERIKYNLSYTNVYLESGKNRINLAETLRKLPLAYFGKHDLADLTSTIMSDATELESIYSHAVSGLYASYFSSGLLSIALIIYNWKMALSLLWIMPLTFLIFSISRKKLKSEFKKTHQAKLQVSSYFQEGLDSISEIKAYNYEKNYSNELNGLLDDYETILSKEETIAGAYINFAYSLLKLGIVSVVAIGGLLFSKGEIDLFTYMAFMIMTSGIYIPLMNTIANMALITFADVRIDRLKKMNAMPIQTGRKDFYTNHYDLEFKDVEFDYEEGIKVLKGISFKAEQNQVTALVGPSGGGKSTTAKLAARFWDIQKGKITLGGEDISKVDPEILLKNYSIVFQDVTLFNLSILENIRIGKKDASDEEVLQAARLARCDDIAENLPEGYDSLIGENGERLSGGERQRISIARAILKDAPIVILDEATASIDAENESKIQKALSELIKDKTVLVIAHRMRTVINADKIIVLKEGKIVEEGRPDQLIKTGGFFAQMNRIQMEGIKSN